MLCVAIVFDVYVRIVSCRLLLSSIGKTVRECPMLVRPIVLIRLAWLANPKNGWKPDII